MKRYQYWLDDDYFDQATKEELARIAGDNKEIEDRFYKDLEFGTGGLRGVIGAGTNRMNKYVIRRATQGLANYILGTGSANASVAIAYDSRHKSSEFAEEAALVLAANGIKAYVFSELKPTPMLSYGVRFLHCTAGIVITASHNPPQYNGYKVYWRDGGQIVPNLAKRITSEIEKLADYSQVRTVPREEALASGLLAYIGNEVDDSYFAEAVKLIGEISGNGKEARRNLRVVYTPLHGTGNKPVRRLLQELGFENVAAVPEQEHPDPQFSTVKYPNPEERTAFDLALKVAERENADIIVATDPDCDRVGVVVRTHNGAYESLSGNQTGALLLHYILSSRKEAGRLPGNGVVVKTIVTSELGARVANAYGVETQNTLTGFKYIGERIKQFEEAGDKQFLFGYEESYGYLAGTFARDKDAVTTTALICAMAADAKEQGLNLIDVMDRIYRDYGFFRESLRTITLEGVEGVKRIEQILTDFRSNPPAEIAGRPVVSVSDYLSGVKTELAGGKLAPGKRAAGEKEHLTLPKENVLYYSLGNDTWFCIRPSGTEPKVKIYYSAVGQTAEEVEALLKAMEADVSQRLQVQVS